MAPSCLCPRLLPDADSEMGVECVAAACASAAADELELCSADELRATAPLPLPLPARHARLRVVD